MARAPDLGLVLVDIREDGKIEATFVRNGCRLSAIGSTLEEAKRALAGRVNIFKDLHAFVKSELRYRVIAKKDMVDFIKRCARVYIRQRYPMIKLSQVSAEMKALATMEGDRVALRYDQIVTKIFNLCRRSRSSG